MLFPVSEVEAARTVASGKQVKSAVRPAAKVSSKTRVATATKTKRTSAVAAAPVFRPPKPPAQRHYAVDGTTFYADGVRVRAAGIDSLEMAGASGIAKQRLQQLLDSGRVSIEPLGNEGGDTVARVKIDGRDLSELVSGR
ncbi:thermonuclease family protein [Methyloversatilis thermotolerans]|uniref:thermonuclease family protein n=1 Tax=Methyloversatilis thermotolerans TaxID=1346290 RepID=UPI001E3E4AB1|nr:hypothetical protein [Methyloversatilis thermotolerans]